MTYSQPSTLDSWVRPAAMAAAWQRSFFLINSFMIMMIVTDHCDTTGMSEVMWGLSLWILRSFQMINPVLLYKAMFLVSVIIASSRVSWFNRCAELPLPMAPAFSETPLPWQAVPRWLKVRKNWLGINIFDPNKTPKKEGTQGFMLPSIISCWRKH